MLWNKQMKWYETKWKENKWNERKEWNELK